MTPKPSSSDNRSEKKLNDKRASISGSVLSIAHGISRKSMYPYTYTHRSLSSECRRPESRDLRTSLRSVELIRFRERPSEDENALPLPTGRMHLICKARI